MASPEEFRWWQTGILYEIYPRSFQDTTGDGIGDLQGIRKRLPYLKWLGVEGIWITPFFCSPMADFGYDISNYKDVDPLFGTMADFDELLHDAHRTGIRVILDLVPNHTSDQHPWFKESRSSRDNPKRDWYIWHDPAPDGGPPNNWLSSFSGSAWQFDEKTVQYYYHAFLAQQPDLNWRNPDVRKAMFEVMHFWLKKGVDGFRVDVMWHLIKDDQFRDNPPNPDYKPGMPEYEKLAPVYSTDRPEVHDVIAGMRAVVDSYPGDRVLIGEIWLPTSRLMAYYGPDANGANMPLNFQLVLLPWEARTIDGAINHYEASLPDFGWPNWVLSNHDRQRVATRVGEAQARIAMLLLLTLRGTPTLYYGDEIGMHDVNVPPNRVSDPFEKLEPGKGNGRDPQRTPMQWDKTKNAGFSTGRPWLPVAADAGSINVEAEKDSTGSMLSLTRKLIELRSREPAFTTGGHKRQHTEGEVIAYRRASGSREFLVILNMSGNETEFHLDSDARNATIVLSTTREVAEDGVGASLDVGGNEGLILRLR